MTALWTISSSQTVLDQERCLLVVQDVQFHPWLSFDMFFVPSIISALKNPDKFKIFTNFQIVVLPMQKLIHLHSDLESELDCSDIERNEFGSDRSTKNKNKRNKREPFFKSLLSRLLSSKPLDTSADTHDPAKGFINARKAASIKGPVSHVRTLQRYHGGPNEERIQFMEKHSALASKNLGVGVEQVSIFMTSDNSVISFFESSAEDVETPIIARLGTRETILRRSCDASMLLQVSLHF